MRTTRTAQVLLLVAALMLWGASRLPWVDVSSFDGLGQPKTTTLSGAAWSTALIPLALRGVKYRPGGASTFLGRNLAVYGLGGIIAPFLGIWLIDLLVRLIPGF